MKSEQFIPIETELGYLMGRDCIYFDTVIQDGWDNLIFKGSLNGGLVSKRRHLNQKKIKWFHYKLTFKRVLTCFSCELDTYENITRLAHTDYFEGSSFDLVEKSTWLKSLPVRDDFDRKIYKHYRIKTYDVVYDIICVSYEMKIKKWLI